MLGSNVIDFDGSKADRLRKVIWAAAEEVNAELEEAQYDLWQEIGEPELDLIWPE